MNVQRGDVVLVDYPYAAGGGTEEGARAGVVRQGQWQEDDAEVYLVVKVSWG